VHNLFQIEKNGASMTAAYINICADSELETKTQSVLEDLGAYSKDGTIDV
jgi:hypothetical protein